MPRVKLIALDVLKPHLPDAVEFARQLAGLGDDYKVEIEVIEVDEHTQTTLITVRGEDLACKRIEDKVKALGGSVHSIDRVIVTGNGDDH